MDNCTKLQNKQNKTAVNKIDEPLYMSENILTNNGLVNPGKMVCKY